jgi:hypothetical protein
LCQKLLEDERLFEVLQRFDEDLASQTKAVGCLVCGGRLDVSNYHRKPRGGPKGYDLRLSLCCAVEGCRTRATPPSVRFLGRKIYFATMVVLATAMQQGISPPRLLKLKQTLGVDRRTLKRWRFWWKEVFAHSPFFQALRGKFAKPVDCDRLPRSLLELYGFESDKDKQKGKALLGVLRVVVPITTRPHLDSCPN